MTDRQLMGLMFLVLIVQLLYFTYNTPKSK